MFYKGYWVTVRVTVRVRVRVKVRVRVRVRVLGSGVRIYTSQGYLHHLALQVGHDRIELAACTSLRLTRGLGLEFVFRLGFWFMVRV